MRATVLLALLLTSLVACGQPQPAPSPAVFEATGTDAERVAEVSRLLRLADPPPSPIAAAEYRQEQLGDGSLGPSDYRSFALIAVEPADLDQWRAMLTPRPAPPGYVAPGSSTAWWPSSEQFGALEFYEPGPFGNTANGWVGIDSATGHVYVYSFTT
jgi:hypothetical protein